MVGVFVALFLYLFEPFGQDKTSNLHWKLPVALGFGVVSLGISWLNFHFLPKILPDQIREENWKVKHEMLAVSWLIFTIGLGNFIFSHFVSETEFSLLWAVQFQGYTFLIGSIIAAFFFLFEQNWLLNRHLKAAQDMNQRLESVHTASRGTNDLLVLTSENEKEHIKIKNSNLIFIRSADNYVEIFRQKNESVDMILLRSSLKRIEDLLKTHPHIRRCHRAYLVNLNQIHRVVGDSQGYQLQFRNTPLTVPVSRNYAKEIRQTILQA
jgi:DNA-binding LytR/AlgR family response regulator